MIGVLFMESARPEAKHHKSTSGSCCLATGPPGVLEQTEIRVKAGITVEAGDFGLQKDQNRVGILRSAEPEGSCIRVVLIES